uniref:Uncharacterized protein n=1 Tax=Arundo donax TaxID=35708 RepID=A0A0A9BV47_ARUDO
MEQPTVETPGSARSIPWFRRLAPGSMLP